MTTISGQGSINWNPLQPATAGAAEQLSNTGIIKAPVVQSDGTTILKDFVVTIQAGSRAELQKIMDEINPVAIGTLITHEWADDTRKDLGYTTTRLELTNLSTLQSGVDKPKLLHTYKPKGNSQEKTLDRTTPLDNIVSNLFNQIFSGISQHPSQQTVQAPEPRAQQLPRSGTVMTIEALRTPLAHPTLAAHTTAPPPYPTHLAQPSSSGQTGATAHAAHSASASQSQSTEQHLIEAFRQKMIDRDYKGAFGILQSASDRNSLPPTLKLALASFYVRGADGVDKDFPKAKILLNELKNITQFKDIPTKLLTELEISTELDKFESRDFITLSAKLFPDDAFADLNAHTKILGTYYEANKNDYKDIPGFISELRAKLKTDDDGLLAKIKDFALNPALAAARQTTPAPASPAATQPVHSALAAQTTQANQSPVALPSASMPDPSLARADSEPFADMRDSQAQAERDSVAAPDSAHLPSPASARSEGPAIPALPLTDAEKLLSPGELRQLANDYRTGGKHKDLSKAKSLFQALASGKSNLVEDAKKAILEIEKDEKLAASVQPQASANAQAAHSAHAAVKQTIQAPATSATGQSVSDLEHSSEDKEMDEIYRQLDDDLSGVDMHGAFDSGIESAVASSSRASSAPTSQTKSQDLTPAQPASASHTPEAESATAQTAPLQGSSPSGAPSASSGGVETTKQPTANPKAEDLGEDSDDES